MMNPKYVWLAKNQVWGYADPTEPTKYPELYTKFYEASAYQALEKENEQLRDAVKLSFEREVKLRDALKFYANNPGNNSEDGAAYEPENNPLKIRDRGSRARQALHGPREGEGT